MRINWTFVSALCLAAISLTFSAHGLVSLFSGAGVGIVLMAIFFEFAKVMTTIYLIRSFAWRPLPVALSVVLLALVWVSSMGIYGYLGQAYDRGREAAVLSEGRVSVVREELAALEAERAEALRLIELVPEDHSTNRRRILESQLPRIERLDSAIAVKRQEAAATTLAKVEEEHDIGQLRYAAALVGVSDQKLAQAIITVLALLLDPMAVLLVLASGVHLPRQSRVRPVRRTPSRKSSSSTPRATPVASIRQIRIEEPPAKYRAALDEPVPGISPALNRLVAARGRKQP